MDEDATISIAGANLAIPGYRIEKPLGSGAMATVYLAVQESLDRQVALKIMAASLAADPSFHQRFLKEGKIIAQLNHPHIVTIYDIGVFQTYHYMAMEYVSGGTLKERLEGLSVDRAVEIFCQIAGALGYAHQRHFVHRDVKPANILFRDDGTAVLSDFGIAKTLEGGTQITATGFAVGTPAFMSPEQILGKTVDSRSDLYALGVVFYEMLTGTRPYQAADSFALAMMHVNQAIPNLPGELADYQVIIDKLMAKEPDDRFPSAQACIDILSQIHPRSRTAEDENDETIVVTEQGSRVAVSLGSIPVASAPARSRYIWPGLALLALLGAFGYLFWPGTTALTPTEPAAPGTTAQPTHTQPLVIPPATEPTVPEIVEPTATLDSEPALLDSEPALSEREQEQLSGLLSTAEWSLEYEQLDHALAVCCQALQLSKQDEQAKTLLGRIAEAYAAVIPALNTDKLEYSLELAESCEPHPPNFPALLALREQLKQQLQQ